MPRRWVVLTVVGGTAAVVAALAWVALGSRLLAVRTVQVAGVHRVSQAEVVKAAGILPGTPLARVDVGEVRRRVAALREVESVEVQRRWPSTLRVVVTERTPVAVMHTDAGYVLLDRFGVAVATVPRRPRGLPTLDVDQVRRDDPAARAALAVLHALPHGIAAKVRSVSAPQPDDVTLRLRDGAMVVWGGTGRSSEKARALAALLRHEASTYDVSSPDVVTTR